MRKSLASAEHIISLIDGKSYKTLKRHLTARGLTPDEYRSRYNLPTNYPMVAPAYVERRRAVAQQIGLGRRKSEANEPATINDEAIVTSGAVEGEVAQPQPSQAPDNKQRSPKVAKKSADARASETRTAQEAAPAPTPDLTSAAEAGTSSEAPTIPNAPSTATEAAAAFDDLAPSVGKKRAAKSAPAKSAERTRSKAKAEAVSELKPAKEGSSGSPLVAADAQNVDAPAQNPKRRAKLGVFKKLDA